MKDGTLRAVVLVSSINFALKSEEEQNAIISGYVSFLNNIDFPLQIVIQSRELNIDRTIVSRYLKINKIPKRSSKDQFHINFPPKRFKLTFQIISFIEGLLLGESIIMPSLVKIEK